MTRDPKRLPSGGKSMGGRRTEDGQGRAARRAETSPVSAVPSVQRSGIRTTEGLWRLRFQHPGREVALRVQYPPDVEVVLPLDVGHQIRVALQRPGAKPFQQQLEGIAWRAHGRMLRDPPEGPLQRIDEGQRERLADFRRVAGDGLVDIPLRRFPRNDWLGGHACGWRTRRRSMSK